ncbi:MAG TPA: hypothetical protein VMV33_03485 [Rhodocyclaceae bacterium]|nr:hypothetical protein [Rhodocyclaceae bacterium]
MKPPDAMQLRYILAQFNDRGKSPEKAGKILVRSACSPKGSGSNGVHPMGTEIYLPLDLAFYVRASVPV